MVMSQIRISAQLPWPTQGVLPKVNEKQLQFAVLLGLACECDLREENQYARKNYFYADMPKGYQITQDETPICTNGFVRLKDADGKEKKVSLTRIHMEEDSGKKYSRSRSI